MINLFNKLELNDIYNEDKINSIIKNIHLEIPNKKIINFLYKKFRFINSINTKKYKIDINLNKNIQIDKQNIIQKYKLKKFNIDTYKNLINDIKINIDQKDILIYINNKINENDNDNIMLEFLIKLNNFIKIIIFIKIFIYKGYIFGELIKPKLYNIYLYLQILKNWNIFIDIKDFINNLKLKYFLDKNKNKEIFILIKKNINHLHFHVSKFKTNNNIKNYFYDEIMKNKNKHLNYSNTNDLLQKWECLSEEEKNKYSNIKYNFFEYHYIKDIYNYIHYIEPQEPLKPFIYYITYIIKYKIHYFTLEDAYKLFNDIDFTSKNKFYISFTI